MYSKVKKRKKNRKL